jgi:ankyrin repeat protein/DNA-directed RNA polymerase specialized sigma24 family protein
MSAGGEEIGRHVHLVYSACLRQLREPALAEEATGAVFAMFAKAAGKLKNEVSFVPWLFDAAHEVCGLFGAPRDRDDEAGLGARRGSTEWPKYARRIDGAIASLGKSGRRALLLKYVANLSLRDVAAALKVSEQRAGQLIAEGIAGVRRYLESRGLAIAPDALVAGIQAHLVQSAPAAVVNRVMEGAFAPATSALAMAERVMAARRRAGGVKIATFVCVVLILGLGVFKVQTAVRSAVRATTQATTAPIGSNDPANVEQPKELPVPEAPLPPVKAMKPVDPQLALRTIAAIRQSDTAALQQLVETDENVINAKDPVSGRSAVEIAAELVTWNRPDATRIAHFLIQAGAVTDIHTAARAGDADYVAQLLLRDRTLIESKDARGLTPLQRAALLSGASPDCEEVVDMLIRVGARVDLWTACTFGRLVDVKRDLAEHPEEINQPCLGATPLNWALRPRRYAEDPLAIPKLLLEKGADARSRDVASDGMTPLHHAAAWGGQAAVAGLLIEKGVDVNILDDFGWTPLDYAIDRGRKEMVAFFKSKGGRRTTLEYPDRPVKTARFFAAVESNDVELTHALLDDTPELAKSRGPTGETPLHWAAASGSIAIIDLLLADKADLNAQETNKFGGTPLHWAVEHDRVEAVKHLLEKGADAKAMNARSGQTLLHVAAQHTDDAALAELLLGRGIDLTIRDRFGKMAGDYAAASDHSHVAERLRSGR